MRITARTILDRRMRWFGWAFRGGFVVTFAGAFCGIIRQDEPYAIITIPGVVVIMAVGLLFHLVLLRCPWCRGNMAPVLMNQGWPSRASRVCFCAYCGRSLDEELESPVSGGSNQVG